ncbi:hypothetical protein C8R44DRAFT_973811 [Mycena epipterygia]|nr:hypothetical protein C8R44DRAFT_973811 [Mycena epipterygia]
MEPPTSELAQELVELIVSFLHNSPTDLSACALVSRSWVYAAQSLIFRRISFMPGIESTDEGLQLLSRFKEVSDASPHLIRHVHRLDVDANRLSIEIFLAICNFPFPHLDSAALSCNVLPHLCTLALQNFLSLPTLTHLRINCYATDPSAFAPIWDRCSPSLRHLELAYQPESNGGFGSSHHLPPSIRLESLCITTTDVSLSIWTKTGLLHSPQFAPALQTIETLDFLAAFDGPIVDISLFPRLTLLCITVYYAQAWPWMLDTLSTIVPSDRTLKIVIAGQLSSVPSRYLESFDSHLSGLPLSHIIEVRTGRGIYARMIPNLPRLSEKNMLRRADSSPKWFRSLTGML